MAYSPSVLLNDQVLNCTAGALKRGSVVSKSLNKVRFIEIEWQKKGSGESSFLLWKVAKMVMFRKTAFNGTARLKAESSDIGMTPNSELKPNPRAHLCCWCNQLEKDIHIPKKDQSKNYSVLSVKASACSLNELSGSQSECKIYRVLHRITKLQLKARAISIFLFSVLIKQKPHSRQQTACTVLSGHPAKLYLREYILTGTSHTAPDRAKPCRGKLPNLLGFPLAVNRVKSCLSLWARYE